jgi:hypothetical protein
MTPLSSDSTLRIHTDVVWRDVDGEIVLLHVTTGQYYGLDGVAIRVWQLLEGDGTSLRKMCEALKQEYDVDPATVEADVSSLMDGLVTHQLVAVAG